MAKMIQWPQKDSELAAESWHFFCWIKPKDRAQDQLAPCWEPFCFLRTLQPRATNDRTRGSYWTPKNPGKAPRIEGSSVEAPPRLWSSNPRKQRYALSQSARVCPDHHTGGRHYSPLRPTSFESIQPARAGPPDCYLRNGDPDLYLIYHPQW